MWAVLSCGGDPEREKYGWLRREALIDTIVMDTTSILFPHVRLHDREGNLVEIDGGIYHDQFKDFNLDLHVDAHKALVFDSEEKGQMLQGRVYANGHVDVTGPDNNLVVAADAVTTKNSRFRLSVDNVSSAYESNFIHFTIRNMTWIISMSPMPVRSRRKRRTCAPDDV